MEQAEFYDFVKQVYLITSSCGWSGDATTACFYCEYAQSGEELLQLLNLLHVMSTAGDISTFTCCINSSIN